MARPIRMRKPYEVVVPIRDYNKGYNTLREFLDTYKHKVNYATCWRKPLAYGSKLIVFISDNYVEREQISDEDFKQLVFYTQVLVSSFISGAVLTLNPDRRRLVQFDVYVMYAEMLEN